MSKKTTDDLDDGVLFGRMCFFWLLNIGWVIFTEFEGFVTASISTLFGVLFATMMFAILCTIAYTTVRLVVKRIVVLIRDNVGPSE